MDSQPAMAAHQSAWCDCRRAHIQPYGHPQSSETRFGHHAHLNHCANIASNAAI